LPVQLHVRNEDEPKALHRLGTTGPRASSKIANDAVLIDAGSAIIDGEVVVPSANGTTDFCRQLSDLRD